MAILELTNKRITVKVNDRIITANIYAGIKNDFFIIDNHRFYLVDVINKRG